MTPARLAWLAAGAGLAGAIAVRALRRRGATRAAPRTAADERAEELRRRLAEARGLAEEREAFEDRELTVDRAEAAADDAEERRRGVHQHGRAAVDEMRASEPR